MLNQTFASVLFDVDGTLIDSNGAHATAWTRALREHGVRVNEARVNLHLFGVVEGEDDLILMGMVRDVTQRFVERYLGALLGVIEAANRTRDGGKLAPEQRILRIGAATLVRAASRGRCAAAR